MHCVDGNDYSIFSILPPYNNLHAQLIKDGNLVNSGISLTYEATADSNGSWNTTSVGKTNFWDYADTLYGSVLEQDVGLTGKRVPSTIPEALDYNQNNRWFEAEGIPIMPVDDTGSNNPYPMVKVVARDPNGDELAAARVVLPVSSEMSCISCHASTTSSDPALNGAKPLSGWISDPDPEKDWKKNILALHDEMEQNNALFTAALSSSGYGEGGLLASALGGAPVLCARCHSSNALPGTGIDGISPLTQAIHNGHSRVSDPQTGVSLNESQNRDSCYLCHPGSTTQCLRGAMGSATNGGETTMDCQSCHGSIRQVGDSQREGWLDQPNCQSCHHDGLREVRAIDSSGKLLQWGDSRFATNSDTPSSGYSLYRYSRGHGDLQCEACHGATHAIYPSSHANDNILAQDLQGYSGTIATCSVCHDTVPLTATGGPHGMHTTGESWVKGHEDYAERDSSGCTACHGSDYRGGVLSQVKTARSFSTEWGLKTFSAGQSIGCYDCHNGPSGD
ncbi:MAG: hypothetical protein HQL48_08865 [Gammaproteobacteria bacterium]|nr:hypothetical protein [Gammaproteobacteria bacterium]